MARWPATPADLDAWQGALAAERPEPFHPPAGPHDLAIGGCFVCFPRGAHGPGARGDPGWAAAAVTRDGRTLAVANATGHAGAPYVPGRLALREGPLLEAAVRQLPQAPDVLLADATGRDHPRRAGLALALGAVLDIPTVGVTHRPLVAHGDWPADARGAASPLLLGDETVGAWLRVRAGRRPLAVHPAWRTDLSSAIAVTLAATSGGVRTPAPLREARRAARLTRSAAAAG